MVGWTKTDKPTEYGKFKQETFIKHIHTFISQMENIRGNSLKNEDKYELFVLLKSSLEREIDRIKI